MRFGVLFTISQVATSLAIPIKIITFKTMYVARLYFKPLFIAAFFSAGICQLGAQTLEWRYVFDYAVNTRSGDLLVDENQEVFTNISTQRPDGSYRGGGMVALDAKGRFNGMIMMTNPVAEATFAPFGDGRYISSQWGETRIFDAQGDLIATGKGFGGNPYARITTTKGHVYFTKPLDRFESSYITIGTINNDFEVEKDSIPLQPIAIDGLGMSLTYKKPARTSHGVWMVPFQYGRVNGGMSVEHTIVAAIKDEKILWTFPPSLTDHPVVAVTAQGERIGVVCGEYRRTHRFYLLDQNGVTQTQFDFQFAGRIEGVRINQDQVSILTSHSMYVYTLEGLLVQEISISNDFLINPTEFEVMDNGDYIIAGNYQGQATIIRINMSGQDTPPIASDLMDVHPGDQRSDNAPEASPVSQVSLQTVSEETISASVFPNPASLYINFELKNGPTPPFTIAVFDGAGQLLHKDTFEVNSYRLSLEQFVPGTYVYRLQSSSSQEKILSGQFIKI